MNTAFNWVFSLLLFAGQAVGIALFIVWLWAAAAASLSNGRKWYALAHVISAAFWLAIALRSFIVWGIWLSR